MKNVMIVEGEDFVRKFFETLIRESEGYQVVYSINSANMSVHYCSLKKIDLILMDAYIPNDSCGFKASKQIKKEFPAIKIIVTTSLPEFSWIRRAKEIGVESFLYKHTDKDNIISIMNRTLAGERIYPERTPKVSIGNTYNHNFSYREMEIMRELTDGDSNISIGVRLGISPNTVRNVIQRMLEKTGFKNRTELAVEARRLGIVIKDNYY